MQLRRLIFLSSLVLAVAAVSPAAAQGATNGTDRPLKGTQTGTAIINVATGTGTVDGTFRLTHLGKGTSHADVTSFTFTGADTFASTGTTTIVAANGDRVFATDAVSGTISTGESTVVETITGGTGRFADASGTFTVTGVGVIVSIVGSTVTSTFTNNTAVGEISY